MPKGSLALLKTLMKLVSRESFSPGVCLKLVLRRGRIRLRSRGCAATAQRQPGGSRCCCAAAATASPTLKVRAHL